ncbi:hypothetical protein LAZ67_2001972 [Cordylochernes scorpioides]|uniref:TIR domain-containing protein n=1 Tax=Cordylochernes scorpioides TaxID=51811 RepID=A0ABY6K1T1_9ARAC|nr:hypothetical protein LAZ67_2001972 [Cordylochernes scorpioides]
MNRLRKRRSLSGLPIGPVRVMINIDDIKSGEDWSDKLGQAVNECQLFIPLITPSYGLTKWTDKELKLADMKRKKIIPINFLKKWPPLV